MCYFGSLCCKLVVNWSSEESRHFFVIQQTITFLIFYFCFYFFYISSKKANFIPITKLEWHGYRKWTELYQSTYFSRNDKFQKKKNNGNFPQTYGGKSLQVTLNISNKRTHFSQNGLGFVLDELKSKRTLFLSGMRLVFVKNVFESDLW